MSELFAAFLLGNSAILTNVCILPLYPGLIAFMTGNANNPRAQRASRWLGLLVLAGVLSLMTLVGLLLYLLRQSFGAILPVLLPRRRRLPSSVSIPRTIHLLLDHEIVHQAQITPRRPA